MLTSIVGKYVSETGMELQNAFIIFKGATIFSHTVTEDDRAIEYRDVEFSFNVYVSESAYNTGKPSFETFSKVMPLESYKTIDEQALLLLKQFEVTDK